jgi:hypothetical protein
MLTCCSSESNHKRLKVRMACSSQSCEHKPYELYTAEAIRCGPSTLTCDSSIASCPDSAGDMAPDMLAPPAMVPGIMTEEPLLPSSS